MGDSKDFRKLQSRFSKLTDSRVHSSTRLDEVSGLQGSLAIVAVGPEDAVASHATVHAGDVTVYFRFARRQAVMPKEHGDFVERIGFGVL